MRRKKTSLKALRRAIALAGDKQALADLIGVSRTLVSFCANPARREEITFRLAQKIEKALNGHVTKEQLRPDIYR